MAIANVVKAAWESIGFTVNVNAVGTVESVVGDGASETKILDSELQVIVNKAAREDFYGEDRGFDVIGIDWQMYSTDPFVALSAFADRYSGSGVSLPALDAAYGNIAGYSDEAYNELIKKAYNETNVKERNDILHEAEEKLVESACIVPLVFNQTFTFQHKHISKVKFDGFGNIILTDMKQKKYEKYKD